MEKNEQQLPEGFNKFDSILSAQKHNLETWDSTGISDLYSTGIKELDEYLGGGFGKKGDYEIVLIHSQPKTYKSTLALLFMMDAVKRGIPQGWAILEGSLAEAMNRLRKCYTPYENFDKLVPMMDKNVFVMSREMRQSRQFTLNSILKWMEHLHLEKGVNLFFIDPLGYAFDFSTRDPYENEWSRQSRFMIDLAQFGERTNCTIVIVQHNTKDSSGPNASYRAAAVGGSHSLTKTSTKAIELRREKDGITSTGERYRRVALEYYYGRHTFDHDRCPMMIDFLQLPDGKGLHLFVPKFRSADDKNIFGEKKETGRTIWSGQVNPNAADLEDLLNG